MNMSKFFVMPLLALGAVALSSCGCCSGEDAVPKLKPLPKFAPLPDGGNAPAAAAAVHSPAPEVVEDFK